MLTVTVWQDGYTSEDPDKVFLGSVSSTGVVTPISTVEFLASKYMNDEVPALVVADISQPFGSMFTVKLEGSRNGGTATFTATLGIDLIVRE